LGFTGYDHGTRHLTSISQEEDGQNRDCEKPDGADGEVRCGRRTAVEKTGDGVMVAGQKIVNPKLLSGAQATNAPRAHGFVAGKSFEDIPQTRIQVPRLRCKALAELVPKAAKYKRPNQVHLGNGPSAIVPAEPRVPLYKRDCGVEQIGKKKRQEQNEESAPGEVDNRCRSHEERRGSEYIPRAIVQ
jgi:hypothetical protein